MRLSEEDYEKLAKLQPVKEGEENVMMKNSFDHTTRLSCQITVKPEIEGITFHIEK